MSVGPTRGPVQRPSDDRDFTEIFQRLDDLERALSAAGIKCAFLNECDWLSIETSGEIPSTDDGIHIIAHNGKDIEIEADGGGNLTLDATQIQLTAGVLAFVETDFILSTLSVNGVKMILRSAGGTLDVLDSGGNPIFRVDEDGDLHGKTGKALTFDL